MIVFRGTVSANALEGGETRSVKAIHVVIPIVDWKRMRTISHQTDTPSGKSRIPIMLIIRADAQM